MNCLNCEKEFIPRTRRHKFCSQNCSMKYWIKKNPERYKELGLKQRRERKERNKMPLYKIPASMKDKSCQKCGAKENLVVHHLDYEKHEFKDENLKTLCLVCHNKAHKENSAFGFTNCLFCGKKFARRNRRHKYCSKKCAMNDWIKKNPDRFRALMRKQYSENKDRYYVRKKYGLDKLKKSQCEKCGSTESLELHHLDYLDRSLNADNIMTLCKKCHLGWHKENGMVNPPKNTNLPIG